MLNTILSPDHHGEDFSSEVMNEIIDLDRYPIHELDGRLGKALLENCRQSLDNLAASSLHGFLRPDAIKRAQLAMTELLPKSYRFPNVPRKTFPFPDPNVAKSSFAREVRGKKHNNSNNQILNYQIPNNSELRAIFLWPPFVEFIRRVRRVETLFPSQCPHLALTSKIAFEGDTDGWHYDPNDGVVTLLLQQPEAGGQFEYAPNIRSDSDENYSGLKALFDNPEKEARRVDQYAGTLVFFNGRNSMHRVRPVGPTVKPRIVIIFSYDLRSSQLFGESYIRMIHDLKQGTSI
tara:strand:- start:105 stop:977 length:873 start_codon:yes stop_codon:yes gene_type:complete